MRLRLDNDELIFQPIDISQSELKSIRRCPLKWFFKHVWRIRPNSTKPALIIGGMFHDTVAEWFDPTTPLHERTEELLLDIFQDVYRERLTIDLQDSDQRIFKLLYQILIEYHREYASDFEFVLVEQEFRVPVFLSEMLVGYVHGRLDGVVRKNDQLWIIEHKTTKRFSFDHLAMDLQADIYSLAGAKLFGENFGGMIYDFVRTKPSKKRPNFARVPVVRSQATLSVFEQDLALEMVSFSKFTPYDVVAYPNRDCEWFCSYKPLCLARRAGVSMIPLVKTGYHLREDEDDSEEVVVDA